MKTHSQSQMNKERKLRGEREEEKDGVFAFQRVLVFELLSIDIKNLSWKKNSRKKKLLTRQRSRQRDTFLFNPLLLFLRHPSPSSST